MLAQFLDYVMGPEKVWVARRIDIAGHWHERAVSVQLESIRPMLRWVVEVHVAHFPASAVTI